MKAGLLVLAAPVGGHHLLDPVAGPLLLIRVAGPPSLVPVQHQHEHELQPHYEQSQYGERHCTGGQVIK